MAKQPVTITIDPESELGQLLDAGEADLLLEKEGVLFRVHAVEVPAPLRRAGRPRLAPERVLTIIGRGASAHGSDIARLKDQYVADAAAKRGALGRSRRTLVSSSIRPPPMRRSTGAARATRP